MAPTALKEQHPDWVNQLFDDDPDNLDDEQYVLKGENEKVCDYCQKNHPTHF